MKGSAIVLVLALAFATLVTLVIGAEDKLNVHMVGKWAITESPEGVQKYHVYINNQFANTTPVQTGVTALIEVTEELKGSSFEFVALGAGDTRLASWYGILPPTPTATPTTTTSPTATPEAMDYMVVSKTITYPVSCDNVATVTLNIRSNTDIEYHIYKDGQFTDQGSTTEEKIVYEGTIKPETTFEAVLDPNKKLTDTNWNNNKYFFVLKTTPTCGQFRYTFLPLVVVNR